MKWQNHDSFQFWEQVEKISLFWGYFARVWISVEMFWGTIPNRPTAFIHIKNNIEVLQIELTSAILEELWDKNYLSSLPGYLFWCFINTSNTLQMEKLINQLEWEVLVKSKKDSSSTCFLTVLKSKEIFWSKASFCNFRDSWEGTVLHILKTTVFSRLLATLCLFCPPGSVGIPYAWNACTSSLFNLTSSVVKKSQKHWTLVSFHLYT